MSPVTALILVGIALLVETATGGGFSDGAENGDGLTSLTSRGE
jgi:hypothetical protein